MQHLQPNTLLQGGKYKIINKLGQGGFGITYLAEQVMLGRKVAVKEFFMKELCNRDSETSQVSVGSVGSLDMVERFKDKFLKEARLIATMDNNHIVRIHDIFEENGTAYYIMENVDGGSLESMVNGHHIDEALSYDRANLWENYLKINTIKSGERYGGFFNIKYKKADGLVINIKIDGVVYTFPVNC